MIYTIYMLLSTNFITIFASFHFQCFGKSKSCSVGSCIISVAKKSETCWKTLLLLRIQDLLNKKFTEDHQSTLYIKWFWSGKSTVYSVRSAVIFATNFLGLSKKIIPLMRIEPTTFLLSAGVLSTRLYCIIKIHI